MRIFEATFATSHFRNPQHHTASSYLNQPCPTLNMLQPTPAHSNMHLRKLIQLHHTTSLHSLPAQADSSAKLALRLSPAAHIKSSSRCHRTISLHRLTAEINIPDPLSPRGRGTQCPIRTTTLITTSTSSHHAPRKCRRDSTLYHQKQLCSNTSCMSVSAASLRLKRRFARGTWPFPGSKCNLSIRGLRRRLR